MSLVDILPTMLDAMGLAAPQGVEGQSLWPLLTGGAAPAERTLYAEYMLYGRERKMALRWPNKVVVDTTRPLQRLHDLSLDPGEKVFVQDRPGLMRAMIVTMRQHLDRLAEEAGSQRAEIPPEVQERLEALGYLK